MAAFQTAKVQYRYGKCLIALENLRPRFTCLQIVSVAVTTSFSLVFMLSLVSLAAVCSTQFLQFPLAHGLLKPNLHPIK